MPQKSLCISEQLVERRASACRDNTGAEALKLFNAIIVDDRIGAGGTGCFGEKDAFALIGLDQMNFGNPEDCEDKSRKAGATAEIDERACGRRQQRDELGGIEQVATPGVRQCC